MYVYLKPIHYFKWPFFCFCKCVLHRGSKHESTHLLTLSHMYVCINTEITKSILYYYFILFSVVVVVVAVLYKLLYYYTNICICECMYKNKIFLEDLIQLLYCLYYYYCY